MSTPTTAASTKTPPIAAILLSRAHSPDEATRIHTEKIQQRPLFLTPSSPPPSSDARTARRRARERTQKQRKKALKPQPLSATQRRRLGLYNLPAEARKYALFEPLHRLWVGYVLEVLGAEVFARDGAAMGAVGAKLASADLHGALVEVVRSGCVSRVGIKGIVVRDSRFAFEIVTKRDRVRLVPKEGTVFRFEVPVPIPGDGGLEKGGEGEGAMVVDGGREGRTSEGGKEEEKQQQRTSPFVFEIHGEQFQFRSADRASRKFRSHFSKKL